MSRSKLKVQLEFDLRRGQALRDVGLPLGGGVRQPLVAGGQAARQRLQVLQRVPDVVLHLRRLRLVHQRQQARADVVVQVLRDARALLAAPALDRLVVGHGAAQLLDDAVGQARVVAREHALAALRRSAARSSRRGRARARRRCVGTGTSSVEPSPSTRERVGMAGPACCTSSGSNRSRSSRVSSSALSRGRASTSRSTRYSRSNMRSAPRHVLPAHRLQQPLPRAGIDRQREEHRQRQRGEGAEREDGDEQQVQRGGHRARAGQQRELAHQRLRAREERQQQQQRGQEQVPDHRAERRRRSSAMPALPAGHGHAPRSAAASVAVAAAARRRISTAKGFGSSRYDQDIRPIVSTPQPSMPACVHHQAWRQRLAAARPASSAAQPAQVAAAIQRPAGQAQRLQRRQVHHAPRRCTGRRPMRAHRPCCGEGRGQAQAGQGLDADEQQVGRLAQADHRVGQVAPVRVRQQHGRGHQGQRQRRGAQQPEERAQAGEARAARARRATCRARRRNAASPGPGAASTTAAAAPAIRRWRVRVVDASSAASAAAGRRRRRSSGRRRRRCASGARRPVRCSAGSGLDTSSTASPASVRQAASM